ncbi:MAG: hypothetical protein M5U35_04220 [Roseovarius sp.]|nr:hypothetical protein [Roseovarius sp.]
MPTHFIFGTTGNDTLSGTSASDFILAGEGDDLISAGGTLPGETDWIYGQEGNDDITLTGNGMVRGGAGNDTIRGEATGDADIDLGPAVLCRRAGADFREPLVAVGSRCRWRR